MTLVDQADDALARAQERRERAMNRDLPVMEIFGPTIQGEGHLAGTQTHFIRFGLCDYKCTMCDSIAAVNPQFVHEHAMWMTQDKIWDEVRHKLPQHTPWITISGGNPAMHDLDRLVSLFHNCKYKLAIETQGTLAPDWIGRLECITVSPKSPGMGEKFEPIKFGNFLAKYKHRAGLNVKVVIFSNQDLEFASMINDSFVKQFELTDKFYLSLGNSHIPVIENGELLVGTDKADEHKLTLLKEYAILAEEITADHRLSNARFQPQLHVLAWSNAPGR